MDKTYKGSCLCGQVRFEASGFSEQAANCHCSMCRKFHGAAFGTLVSVSNLKWLSGLSQLKDYVAPKGTIRTFCKECGSSLGFRVKGAPFEQLEIALSTFDDQIPVTIDAHIYTNNKASWHNITDNLPKYGEGQNA
jgi:hypothetical protein